MGGSVLIDFSIDHKLSSWSLTIVGKDESLQEMWDTESKIYCLLIKKKNRLPFMSANESSASV